MKTMVKHFLLLLACSSMISCRQDSAVRSSRYYFDERPAVKMGNAASSGNLDRIRALSGEVDLDKPGREGMTFLHLAFLNNQHESLKLLLQLGASPDVPCSVEEQTYTAPLLCIASKEQSTDYVAALLANGADIAVTDTMGETAIFYAARQGANGNLELLLSHGADPLHLSRRKESAIVVALARGRGRSAELLALNGGLHSLDSFQGRMIKHKLDKKLRVANKKHPEYQAFERLARLIDSQPNGAWE